jgi:hypothetical protein
MFVNLAITPYRIQGSIEVQSILIPSLNFVLDNCVLELIFENSPPIMCLFDNHNIGLVVLAFG